MTAICAMHSNATHTVNSNTLIDNTMYISSLTTEPLLSPTVQITASGPVTLLHSHLMLQLRHSLTAARGSY